MELDPNALIARLRTNPDDVGAYEALKAHYHGIDDFASLANLVEGYAARVEDPLLGADAYHEAARTVSYYLDDQPRAIELIERALDRNPAHEAANADLAQLLESLGDVTLRARSLERKASRLAAIESDPVLVASVHYELGQLWEVQLERPEQAVVHYRSAYELDPEHVPAMYATREIYRKSGDLRTASKVYELEIGAEPDSTRAVMLLRELAHLHREGLSDPDAGIATLERALELLPRDLEVTYELAGALLGRAGSRGDTEPGVADRRRAAALLVRLATRSEGESQIAFFESALDAAPDSDEALSALERVASAARAEDRLPIRWIRYLAFAPDGPNSVERRKRLALAYEAAGQWNDAIACLEPIANPDADVVSKLAELRAALGEGDEVAEVARRSLASMSEAERLAHHRQALEAAEPGSDASFAAARAVLELDPADRGARGALLEGARRRSDHATLRDLLLAQAEDGARVDRERAEAWAELARLAEGPLGDPQLAVRAREALVALSPGDRDARAKLKQTMRLGQRWNELGGVLLWEAVNEEDETAQRNAALSLDELTTRADLDKRRAVDALAAVFAKIPADTVLRDRLLTRRLEVGDERDALPLLEGKAKAAPTLGDKAALFEQAANLREKLGDLAGAVAALTTWLAADPKADAVAERALALAERTEDPKLLASVVAREAERTRGDTRVNWLLRLAAIRERELGDVDGAIEALVRAAEEAGADPSPRLELEAALKRAGRAHELRESLRKRASLSEAEDRIALLREIATVSLDRLDDEAAAIEAHRSIRSIREDRDSLEFLIGRTRTLPGEAGLVELLAAKLDIEDDPAVRTPVAIELAHLLDREGGDRSRARLVLEAMRPTATTPKPLLEHLVRIYDATSDLPALASAIGELLDHETDERRALELARRLHALATGPVESEALTARALAKWSALAPSEIAPLEALVAMHVRAGRERDAAVALVELGKRLDSPSEAESKLLEASTRFEAANDLASAMDAARLSQTLGFGSVASRDRLEAVADKASRFDVVLEIAESRVAESERAVGPRHERTIDAIVACATVARTKLVDPKRAETYLLRASELAEGSPELVARVEAAATALDRSASDAGAVLERALVARLLDKAKQEEGEARLAKFERAITILSEAIGDFDTAFALLAEATAEDPADALFARWVDIAIRGAKLRELESTLRARFDESLDADLARRLLETLASAFAAVQRSSDEADVLRQLFTMRGTPAYRDQLVDALARAGRHDERVLVLDQAMRRAADDERLELGRRVARIWEEDVGNRLEAVDAWKRVLRWSPQDPIAIAALERLGAARPMTSMAPRAPAASPSGSVGLGTKMPTIPPPPAVPSTSPEGSGVMPSPRATDRASTVPPPPPPPSRFSMPPPPASTIEPLLDEVTPVTPIASHGDDEDLLEDVSDLDAIEEIVDAEPLVDHVRSHVSLPPPPPTRPRE